LGKRGGGKRQDFRGRQSPTQKEKGGRGERAGNPTARGKKKGGKSFFRHESINTWLKKKGGRTNKISFYKQAGKGEKKKGGFPGPSPLGPRKNSGAATKQLYFFKEERGGGQGSLGAVIAPTCQRRGREETAMFSPAVFQRKKRGSCLRQSVTANEFGRNGVGKKKEGGGGFKDFLMGGGGRGKKVSHQREGRPSVRTMAKGGRGGKRKERGVTSPRLCLERKRGGRKREKESQGLVYSRSPALTAWG